MDAPSRPEMEAVLSDEVEKYAEKMPAQEYAADIWLT